MVKIYKVAQLKGAVVIDNCATLRLKNGKKAIFVGGEIAPECNGFREFCQSNNEDWDCIKLPILQN
jgi:hypothetical protein